MNRPRRAAAAQAIENLFGLNERHIDGKFQYYLLGILLFCNIFGKATSY
jgi:hypothetical protein